MLLLTTDQLEVISSAAGSLDYICQYADNPSGTTVNPGRAQGNLNSVATTAIVAAPGSGVRKIIALNIRNRHASVSNDVTVQQDVSGTKREMHKVTLKPGEVLQWTENIGWYVVTNRTDLPSGGASTGDQTANAADTYLAGSAFNFNPGGQLRIQPGTFIRWYISATKTAAGTATPLWNFRVGINGTTGDTSRSNNMTALAQTAAIDTALFFLEARVNSVGATGVIQFTYALVAHRPASGVVTGFATQPVDVVIATSAGFDMTVAESKLGISVNPGASGVWTIKTVTWDLVNQVY